MARFWTCHWQKRGWCDDINPEYEPTSGSLSNIFRKRGVSVGDVVYIVSLIDGQLVTVSEEILLDGNIADARRSVMLPEEVPGGSAYNEGSVERILVNRYERDRRARDECVRHYGTSCSLCGFDFFAAYGEAMAGFIYVHHLNPLSSAGEDYQIDPVRDLRPVCPNCHAALHRREPPYSLEEVRQFLEARRHCAKAELGTDRQC